MRTSGSTDEGSERADVPGARHRTTWLRASGRTLRRAAAWFVDRVGFLSG